MKGRDVGTASTCEMLYDDELDLAEAMECGDQVVVLLR